jgi:hypothetical protein
MAALHRLCFARPECLGILAQLEAAVRAVPRGGFKPSNTDKSRAA